MVHKSRSGPTVGSVRAAQTLVWLNPHVYMPAESIVAKARPTLAMGAFIVLLDVLYPGPTQGEG